MWETAKTPCACSSLPPPESLHGPFQPCWLLHVLRTCLSTLFTRKFTVRPESLGSVTQPLTANSLAGWDCSFIIAALPEPSPPTCFMRAEWMMPSGQLDCKLLEDRVHLYHLCTFSSTRGPALLDTRPPPTHNDLVHSSWKPGRLLTAELGENLTAQFVLFLPVKNFTVLTKVGNAYQKKKTASRSLKTGQCVWYWPRKSIHTLHIKTSGTLSPRCIWHDTLWAPASSAAGPPFWSGSWRSCLQGPFKSWQAWEQHSVLTQEDVMVQMPFYFIRLHSLWKPVHVLRSQAKTRIKGLFLPLLHGGGGAGWGEKESWCVRCTCSPWMMIIFKDSDGNRSCY